MGKLRRKRKSQSTTPYSLSSRQKQVNSSTVICNHDEGEVAPLPEEIMDCSSVISLTTSTTSLEKGETANNRKPNQRTKKEKRSLRKDIWKKKIDILSQNKEEKKAEEERKKTVIVGDMQPLVNSLPTFIAKQVSVSEAPSRQKRKTVSVLGEIEKYRAVLRHPEFQKNPLATISEHVQNAVASGVL